MLPTPSTSHIPFSNASTSIYEPSEDSFLILDTLSSPSETSWLQRRFSTRQRLVSSNDGAKSNAFKSPSPSVFVVELGTGSGVIIAFLTAHASTIFGPDTSIISLGVDVNPDACLATRTTVNGAIHDRENGAPSTSTARYLSSIQADLGTSLRSGSVDLLVFNPPYVPTEDVPSMQLPISSEGDFERGSRLLALSYAGGKDGIEVTERFLEEVPRVLSEIGVVYLLLCRQNRPEDVKAGVRGWEGKWRAETVRTSGKVAGWEKLEVVRIWREVDTGLELKIKN